MGRALPREVQDEIDGFARMRVALRAVRGELEASYPNVSAEALATYRKVLDVLDTRLEIAISASRLAVGLWAMSAIDAPALLEAIKGPRASSSRRSVACGTPPSIPPDDRAEPHPTGSKSTPQSTQRIASSGFPQALAPHEGHVNFVLFFALALPLAGPSSSSAAHGSL